MHCVVAERFIVLIDFQLPLASLPCMATLATGSREEGWNCLVFVGIVVSLD